MNLHPANVRTALGLARESLDPARPRALRRRFDDLLSGQRLYWRWIRRIHRAAPLRLPGAARLTVLLQSFNRPGNMDRLARAVACCDFVERIVVASNNPRVDLAAHLRLRDPRLEIVVAPEPRFAGHRWNLAAESGADYFLAIDDDLFLFPEQIAALFEALQADPATPHGLAGTVYRGPPGTTREERRRDEEWVTRAEREVDVIHRAYAVTADHVRRYRALRERLGLSECRFGDDILLSYAAAGRPRVHDFGPLLSCPSSSRGDVALWHTADFFAVRRDVAARCIADAGRTP